MGRAIVGVAFQGYGQRNDARPDAFQSYSNGCPPASNFSKRGGNGATRGPNVRGNDGGWSLSVQSCNV